MYLKGVFYDPLMTALGCTNADLGAMVSFYGIVALICYLPSGILADKFRMRTLAWVGFIGTAVLTLLYAMLPSVQMCYVLFGGMGLTSILIWWGTRFKVIRLCCEEDEYPARIGVSYSIYGVAGLVIGMINVAIVAAIPDTTFAMQSVIIFLGVLIAILGVLSFIFIPDFKGEINKDPSSSASPMPLRPSRPPAFCGLASVTSASTACTRALPTPLRTCLRLWVPTPTS